MKLLSIDMLPEEVSPENRHMILTYLAEDGSKAQLDVTAMVEKIAEAKVMDHMKAWHNHQL